MHLLRRFLLYYLYNLNVRPFFIHVRKITKSVGNVMSVLPPDRPSARNNSVPAYLIFMKLYIRVFFQILSRKLNFNSNLTRITGNLYEDM
jgi:hypothetical protein